jgi:hypothetical protein
MKTFSRLPVLGAFISIIFFLIGLSVFFTNDDFFFLKVSRVEDLSDFVSFFNPLHGPDGFGVYRPLTTQLYYAISRNLFASSHEILRIISLTGLFSVSYLVYKLSEKLTNSSTSAGISVFLYLVSATHYAHLFYSAAFQELGLAFFVLAGCLSLWRRPYLSVLFYILSLMSKETAVSYPLLVLLLYFFSDQVREQIGTSKKLFILTSAHALVLLVYAYFRFFYYGFATGDSYLWEFSPRILNTATWYLLWSFNLPEMWIDFIGPGLHINPNLFKFWARETVVIFGLFVGFLTLIVLTLKKIKFRLLFFSGLWFTITLGPLLFLPWHKFTFYLTLPLVAVSIFLGDTLSQLKHRNILLVIWVLLAVSTFTLTHKTNWISQGAMVSQNIHSYLTSSEVRNKNQIVFYDTPEDSTLPWSPSSVVKVALSDNNYFQVFWPDVSAVYLSEKPAKIDYGQLLVPARQFLGY